MLDYIVGARTALSSPGSLVAGRADTTHLAETPDSRGRSGDVLALDINSLCFILDSPGSSERPGRPSSGRGRGRWAAMAEATAPAAEQHRGKEPAPGRRTLVVEPPLASKAPAKPRPSARFTNIPCYNMT